MNGTELKTLRQSLWLSQSEAAALHGVGVRVYRYWEAGEWTVPDDVAQRMRELDDALNAMADNAWDVYTDMEQRLGVPVEVVLLRYDYDEDLWRYRPDMAGLTANLHAAGIDRTRILLEGEGMAVRIAAMRRADYEAWLTEKNLRDDDSSRAAWAATATDPPTRAKKTEQASGEQNP